MRRSRACRHRGFAYLWVLLVVAFMGIGLTAAAEVYSTAVQRDKERELLGIGQQFRRAIGRYHETLLAGGRREYPTELDDLLRDKRSPGLRRYLRQVFVDPMTGKPEWGLVRAGGRIVGVYSLSQRQPIKQDHFEADDMAFRGKQKYSDWVFTYPADLLLRGDGAAGVPADAASAATAASAPFLGASAP